MNAIQQKCRPKHQALVLKCYPRTTKGAVDVKPNSSELSYLLFYATSRRSKIQKIGAFLEKKTASDVWRMRIGNVQVTLGILAALVEKSPKDAPLIAPCILKILDLILRSADITMIESSLPTFEAFCETHEPTSLLADQLYLQQYQSIVSGYAKLASTRLVQGKGPVSPPVQMRMRNAGLEAIKSIAESDALSSVAGRQMDTIVPMILENLWTDSEDWLEMMLQRATMGDRVEAEKAPLRRRASIATAATAEETNPLASVGTAMDADKLAEEDIGVLAMQCLKKIFVVHNRPQIHAATSALLKFVFDRLNQGETLVNKDSGDNVLGGWGIQMYSIVARWAPVQDRFVVLIVVMNTMLLTPLRLDNINHHITMAAMIGSLLRSDINMIGLSVMDVLLGLVKHMRRLFQLTDGETPSGSANGEKQEPNSHRKDLLDLLERAIGDLATHVYYTEQISDMVAAIMVRLKPTRTSSPGSTPHGEKTENGNAAPGVSVADLTESQSQLDTYFSQNVGRIAALRAVKAILLVANAKTKSVDNIDLSRDKVPLQVWEGSEWLLRDPDGQVRGAYITALVTWLDRETKPQDLKARDESFIRPKSSLKNSAELSAPDGARRAFSSASHRERPHRVRRSQFLLLLHLAIYDNALQYVDNDTDTVLLHILLTKLVFKFGINSVRFGLPMIYRLQEEVQEVESPGHKIRIAALCHGYFWALTEKFEFEASVVGRAIHNEVVRRRSKAFWVDGINIPPPSVESIGAPGMTISQRVWNTDALESEELLPFDDRISLVECIATAYEESSLSPPASPPASPGRQLPVPILGSSMSSSRGPAVGGEMPSAFRQQMLTEWSREQVMEMVAGSSKTESLNGSKTGSGKTRNRLAISTAGLNGNGHLPPSPFGTQRPRSALNPGDRDRHGSMKHGKSSVRSGVTPSTSLNTKHGVASVEQLKMVLSGSMSPQAVRLSTALDYDDDSGSSMVSYDSPSERSFNPAPDNANVALQRSSSGASRRGPLSSNPPNSVGPDHGDEDQIGDVPPVPPLPDLGSLSGKSNIDTHDFAKTKSLRGSVMSKDTARSVDLQELLRGIDSRAGEGSLMNLGKTGY